MKLPIKMTLTTKGEALGHSLRAMRAIFTEAREMECDADLLWLLDATCRLIHPTEEQIGTPAMKPEWGERGRPEQTFEQAVAAVKYEIHSVLTVDVLAMERAHRPFLRRRVLNWIHRMEEVEEALKLVAALPAGPEVVASPYELNHGLR